MRAHLRQIAADLRGSYWFIPTILTLTATILSLVTWWIDTRYQFTMLNQLAYFSEAKPEGARSILSTIAGSMISVAGTVFAVTFAAVVYASGSYGPRLLTNFMTDRGNQVSLGVFIATYVFALLTLRTIRLPSETGVSQASPGFVPELSLLTALALALLSVAVLVYFLHHVPNSIRINNVVAEIGQTVLRQVKERYPNGWTDEAIDSAEAEIGEPVLAIETGYLKVIDYGTLGEVTRTTDCAVRLALRTGDFVHPGVALAWVDGGLTDDVRRRVLSAFATGTSRTTTQDIEFSVDELVEIALRALSPGINDPFTAITCLHWITAGLASLGGRDLARDGGRAALRGGAGLWLGGRVRPFREAVGRGGEHGRGVQRPRRHRLCAGHGGRRPVLRRAGPPPRAVPRHRRHDGPGAIVAGGAGARPAGDRLGRRPDAFRGRCGMSDWRLDGFDLDRFVTDTLAEDIGTGDVTRQSVIPADARFAGVLAAREAIVVAGLPVALALFRRLDPGAVLTARVEDGAAVAAGAVLAKLDMNARALLAAERSALNTLCHMSGVATLTRRYVDAIAGTGARLLDTRKTLPGLRRLEKHAARLGGAVNHRMGLWDAAMIKDNHVSVAGDVGTAVARAVAAGVHPIIVEVDRLDQIEPAIAAGATRLLLDNMGADVLRQAVALVAGRVPTEASGGVRLDTVRALAETGVDYLSVGRLTQSAPAVDIGLDVAAH